MVLYGLLLVEVAALLHTLVLLVDGLVDLLAEYIVLLSVFLFVHIHAQGQVFKVEVLLVVQLDLLQQLFLLPAVKIAQLLRLEVFLVYMAHVLHVFIAVLRV